MWHQSLFCCLTGAPAIIDGKLGLCLYPDNFIPTPKHDSPRIKANTPDDIGIFHALSLVIIWSSFMLLMHIGPLNDWTPTSRCQVSYAPMFKWVQPNRQHSRRKNSNRHSLLLPKSVFAYLEPRILHSNGKILSILLEAWSRDQWIPIIPYTIDGGKRMIAICQLIFHRQL